MVFPLVRLRSCKQPIKKQIILLQFSLKTPRINVKDCIKMVRTQLIPSGKVKN